VAVGELLLELTGETGEISLSTHHIADVHIPLLGLVPALEERDRDENDNGLATVADLDLRILVSAFEAAQCPPPLRYIPSVLWRVCVVGRVPPRR
jgi:hypothetical protein